MDTRWILASVVGSAACAFAFGGTPHAAVAAPPQRANKPAAVPDTQALFDRLNALNQKIGNESQVQELWHHQMEQAQILFQLAAASKDDERNNYLKLAVDSVVSAAIQSPEDQPVARRWLIQLPEQISRAYPGSPIASYAARQQIQAEYEREREAGDETRKAQEHLRIRLMQFAQAMPGAPEAAKAVTDAAQISEALHMPEEAQVCYAYLVEHFSDSPQARKASVSLHRLGLKGQRVSLELPLLFAPNDGQAHRLDASDLCGKVVVLYFWSSASAQAGEDFEALRRLSAAHRDQGLEVVYVNMDANPAAARQFLASQRTAGEHVYLKDGLQDGEAERCGIDTVPQAILIGKDGTVLRNGLEVSQLENEVTPLMPMRGQRGR